MSKRQSELLRFISKSGIIRPHEIVQQGWRRSELARLEANGSVSRIARGLYTVRTTDSQTENHGLVQVAKRVPNGVVCLLSALRFHNMTTQLPHEVWLAIGNKARSPNVEYPPLHVVRFSGVALSEGIQTTVVEDVAIRIYSPAKTVVDCFRYRNKVGIDVAIEALRECKRKRLATIDEIWHIAQVCRIGKVIEPYLQVVE
ncbi:MAG: hypothetical protein K2Y32_24340 [Candidatus Obscuribacterales bacterium]|jgi:predicted transcriptional regulator of viral defense system|nr:hypothetical protein [Candidatus Obscuribacterales bacterium]